MAMEKIRKMVEEGMVRAYMPSHYCLRLMKVAEVHDYTNEFGEGEYHLNPGDPKLEGTRGEHWSPAWKKILSKYLLEDGSSIVPENLPGGTYITIQTNPDPSERRKSVTWAMDARLISDQPFVVGELTIDPNVDMLCMGGDEQAPNLEWGCWPVKKVIFQDTYETII